MALSLLYFLLNTSLKMAEKGRNVYIFVYSGVLYPNYSELLECLTYGDKVTICSTYSTFLNKTKYHSLH